MRPRRSVNVAALVASPEDTPSRPLLRLRIVGLIVLVLFVVMVLRLWSLQILDTKTYAAAVTANQVRAVQLPAPRGLIVDRNDTVLAGNRTENEIVLSRVEAVQHPSVVALVAALVTETPTAVQAAITDPKYSPYEPVPILNTAPQATVQYLDDHQSEYPGVSVEQVTQRQYPQHGTTAAYVLGYVGAITGTELKAHPGQGYTQSSQIGKSGVESEYEQYLRGVPGRQALEVDAQGNVVGTLSTTEPTQGDTVVLNLTLGLQKAAQQALTADMAADRKTVTSGRTPKATDGAVVVLDAESGAVLALASSPTYSLTTWVGGISTAAYAKLSSTCTPPTSDACPLDDNAIQGLYTPGSTFKLATATAALQSGLIGPTTYVDDTGTFTVPNCTSGCAFHDDTSADAGEVNVTSALIRSDDYFFYTMGLRFWNAWTSGKLGQTAIQDTANAYGLGVPTGIDLPDEVSGTVATPQETKKEHQQDPGTYPNGTWNVGTNIEMAFGQGATVVTPIEEAQAYATFVDHGTRLQPQVASEIVGPTGKVVEKIQPKTVGHVTISDYTAILNGFKGVVNTPRGTAYGTFHDDAKFPLTTFPIAGKTGTADLTAGTVKEPNAWFVGFGPTNTTHQYVVAVVVGQGGYGADAAAPAVANIFNYLYANPVSSSVQTPTATQKPSTTPPATNPPAGTPTTTTTTTPAQPGTTTTSSHP
jgi:penicillin-binding protein 2